MSAKKASDDLRDLRIYLAHGGLEGLARSHLGPMLDALSRAGQSRQCDVCGGLGRVPTAAIAAHERELAVVVADRAWSAAILRPCRAPKAGADELLEYRRLREEGGFGEAERYRRAHAADIRAQAADECRGAAAALARLIRAEQAAARADCRLPAGDRTCLPCRGTGWRPRERPEAPPSTWKGEWTDPESDLGCGLDAQPVGGSIRSSGHGVDPGEAATERMGRVASRLARVRARDPVLADALARHLAPDAGGALALWEVVPSGRALLRAHLSELLPSPGAVWAALAERLRTAPTPGLARSLDATRQEALDLARRALAAWAEAGAPAKPRPGAPRATRPRIRPPRAQALDELSALVRQALEAAQ